MRQRRGAARRRRRPTSWTTAGGIGRAPDRLGAEEGHVGRAEPSRRLGVANERSRSARRGRLATEVAALRDGRAEPEEDRFVDERLQPMTGDDGDEQMDRVRAEIDRGADDGAPGGRCRLRGRLVGGEVLGRRRGGARLRTGRRRGRWCLDEGTSGLGSGGSSTASWPCSPAGLRAVADTRARGRTARAGFRGRTASRAAFASAGFGGRRLGDRLSAPPRTVCLWSGPPRLRSSPDGWSMLGRLAGPRSPPSSWRLAGVASRVSGRWPDAGSRGRLRRRHPLRRRCPRCGRGRRR